MAGDAATETPKTQFPYAATVAEWKVQASHIERQMDNAAYTAAHPDDTLVMAGPPRSSGTEAGEVMLPIGALQQITWQQQKPTQPMMAIGSGRTFFTSGKAITNWSAARMWLSGGNLLRVLYNYGLKKISAPLAPSGYDDPASDANIAEGVFNLDSELFYVPFGMGCIFRTKSKQLIGSFYMELCMITSWSTSISAGQSQVVEQVTGVADRILPFKITDTNTDSSAALDAAIAFATGGGAADSAEKKEGD